MTDKPYEERRGGRYERTSKSGRPKLVEATAPSAGPQAPPPVPAVPPAETPPADVSRKGD